MIDLYSELTANIEELKTSIKALRHTGTEYAEAERSYKMAISKKVLELREGEMPATLINLIIYGVKEIAELRFKRDVKKVIYNANQEHINATKIVIRVLENQLSREWNTDMND